MENHGVIIQHLRHLGGLTIQQTARKIGRSVGWVSEIENGSGRCRVTELEFHRIVELLDGAKHRHMFKTWAANAKNRERTENVFDGAVLKFIRLRKEFTLADAAKLAHLSRSYLSKIENGRKAVDLELRNRIMIAYGYSPTSFKNLSTDPARSKVVPLEYKLEILLNRLADKQVESVFRFIQELSTKPRNI